MNLWIRSQDKCTLMIVDYLRIIPKENGRFAIINHSGNVMQELGKYCSLERAIEVFDTIQAELLLQDKPVQDLTDEYNITDNIVYEMPKE